MTTHDPSSLRERLEAYLSDRCGAPARVTGLTRLAGGVSRITWAFDLEVQSGADPCRRSLVLRMDTEKPFIEGSRCAEFALLGWVREQGVPVPEVFCCEDDAKLLGGGFFIMARENGEVRVARLHRYPRFARARKALLPQMAEVLARIHRLTPASGPPKGLELALQPPQQAVQYQEALYRRWVVDPHPVLELAFRWLYRNLPPARPPALIHGDYRTGNMIFDEEGLRVVIDWELAHFGDPLEDLAWVALRSWRGGEDHLAVGGLGTREAFQRAYLAAGGRPFHPEQMTFWDVFVHLRWAVVTVMELGGFLSGVNDIELASLGRRTVEIEWDLLRLLQPKGG